MSIHEHQVEALLFHLKVIAPLQALAGERFAHVDEDSCALMLEQAARFSEEVLTPLASAGDEAGCTLMDGRVRLPPGTAAAWQQWCELGFPALGLPLSHDGLDFPEALQCAVQEVSDSTNIAFGMLAINLRCAAKVLLAHAPPALASEWIAALAAGTLCTTIAISEPQAGSDAGRIRSQARPAPEADGSWLIKGGKIWISYGDHDACENILHLVLARTPDAPAGTRGLALFAVPDTWDHGEGRQRNGVSVLSIEHKMGLHASPTCVLEFQDARGWLLGEPGEGIRKLFVMMNAMRLAVGVQGSAAANAAALHALDYAAERPQGGPPDQPPRAISEHADVRRMLLEMSARAELLRALVLRTAHYLDRAASSSDELEATRLRQCAELMLPAAKTLGAEQGFEVANEGIQVLGGYGYTRDYPLERMARDVRVAAIYEGTSGIQAQDFLLRKVCRDQGAALEALLTEIDAAIAAAAADNPFKQTLPAALDLLRRRLAILLAADETSRLAAAYGFLYLAGELFQAWGGLELYDAATEDRSYQRRLRAALNLHASRLEGECRRWDAVAATPAPILAAGFEFAATAE